MALRLYTPRKQTPEPETALARPSPTCQRLIEKLSPMIDSIEGLDPLILKMANKKLVNAVSNMTDAQIDSILLDVQKLVEYVRHGE
jgi:hypothetical protein